MGHDFAARMRIGQFCPMLLFLCATVTYAEPPVSWRIRPSDNALQDVRDSMRFNNETKPEGNHDLHTAVALMLAVNKNPLVEEFLESFILKSDKHLVSSLDRKLPLWLDSHDFMLRTYGDWDENGKGLQIDRQVTVSRHDLAYAMTNKSNTTKPIWHVLVRKALEKIAEQYSALNANKLLWGNDNDLFDCNQKNVNLLQPDASYDNQRNKRQYLCMISDRVTRLTNIRLRSTPKLDESNVKKDTGNLPRIVNEAQGGMVVLFDKWSPKYLIKGSKTPEAKPEDEDYLRKLKSTEFEAVGLDITKSGRSQEMNYDLQNFMTNNFTYGDIISDNDDRDVHLVYPYRG